MRRKPPTHRSTDILVSDEVENKRAEMYRQADFFRDPEYDAISEDAWFEMAFAYGVDAKGGPAVNYLPLCRRAMRGRMTRIITAAPESTSVGDGP